MAAIQEELILYDKFTNTFNRYIRQAEQASGATNNAKKSVDKMTQSQKAATSASDGLANSIKNLVAGYVGLRGIKSLFNLSDTIASTTARIDMMNDGLQTTDELNNMIWESAQRSRGAYADTAAFVAKLGNLAGDAFSSSAEIVAFAEQINKQIALSGASSTEASAAMLQLTQGLSSGALRGEELNSVLEQTPMIAKTIADYMGVTTGEMRELASEGKVTAEVVKNAMFAAADETNAAFAQMPMTWSQVWTQAQNIMLKTFQPILDIVGQFAQFAANHLDILIPVFYGLAAAVTFYAIAQGIANGALKTFFTTLAAHPVLLLIAVAIGVIVYALYQLVQSMGGLQIAWKTVVDYVLYAWDTLKAGFMTGVYFVMNLGTQLSIALQAIGVGIANFMGDAKVTVLSILQSMINGAIDLINGFINIVNKLPGVAIDTIDHVTFATTAAVENEAAKSARNQELAAAQADAAQAIADRQQALDDMWAQRDADHAARQAEIEALKAQNLAGSVGMSTGIDTSAVGPYSSVPGDVSSIAGNTASIEKSVNMADEDLKNLVDMAEREYVNNINLTAQTPVITVNGANTGRTQADRQALADTIRDILLEQAAAGATRSTARAYSGG